MRCDAAHNREDVDGLPRHKLIRNVDVIPSKKYKIRLGGQGLQEDRQKHFIYHVHRTSEYM